MCGPCTVRSRTSPTDSLKVGPSADLRDPTVSSGPSVSTTLKDLPKLRVGVSGRTVYGV